jgi:uncharacterized protein (TIGR01777 family)
VGSPAHDMEGRWHDAVPVYGSRLETTVKILITGASGMIGSSLIPFLADRRHNLGFLVRRPPKPGAGEVFWNPSIRAIDAPSLEGFDAVIHLAGENLAAGRWTRERKQRILDSRVEGTELLARTLGALHHPPKLLISASAVGFYGDRGEEILDEESRTGAGFLAEVCRKWEQACGPASDLGFRLVVLRLGMVLSRTGGALPRMLPPFRCGLGGRIAAGRQYISWIALEDLREIIHFILANSSFHGVCNAVAPNPATNLEFTRTLGRALHRPTPFPIPASVIRLMFGEMGEQVLLASTRVVPGRLLAAGFRFGYPDLANAIQRILSLGSPPRRSA